MSAAAAGAPDALTPVWGAVTHEVQGVPALLLPLLGLANPGTHFLYSVSSKYGARRHQDPDNTTPPSKQGWLRSLDPPETVK